MEGEMVGGDLWGQCLRQKGGVLGQSRAIPSQLGPGDCRKVLQIESLGWAQGNSPTPNAFSSLGLGLRQQAGQRLSPVTQLCL